jgi:hypothetical protein
MELSSKKECMKNDCLEQKLQLFEMRCFPQEIDGEICRTNSLEVTLKNHAQDSKLLATVPTITELSSFLCKQPSGEL